MRRHAAPPLTVEVRRHGLWHAALLLLASAWVLSWTVWLSGHLGVAAATALGLGCAAAAALAIRRHWQRSGLVLRWDGQCWHWKLRDLRHECSGHAEVCIDLGAWMLLRLQPVGPGCCLWLPLQLRGLERHWHDLRCAVYSPTPDADPQAGSIS